MHNILFQEVRFGFNNFNLINRLILIFIRILIIKSKSNFLK